MLSNPKACAAGDQTLAALTPWSAQGAEAEEQQATGNHKSYTVGRSASLGSECPADPFTPAFNAGTTYPAAGQYSPFSLTVARTSEDEQNLEDLEVHMPPGLTAKIAGVPLCPEEQANAGTCQPESQIGSVTVGVGAGTAPLLRARPASTSPAPTRSATSMAPSASRSSSPRPRAPSRCWANTGRGEEVVRSAILINEKTAAVTVVSNPLPQIARRRAAADLQAQRRGSNAPAATSSETRPTARSSRRGSPRRSPPTAAPATRAPRSSTSAAAGRSPSSPPSPPPRRPRPRAQKARASPSRSPRAPAKRTSTRPTCSCRARCPRA